jgi:hypothetical protein
MAISPRNEFAALKEIVSNIKNRIKKSIPSSKWNTLNITNK